MVMLLIVVEWIPPASWLPLTTNISLRFAFLNELLSNVRRAFVFRSQNPTKTIFALHVPCDGPWAMSTIDAQMRSSIFNENSLRFRCHNILTDGDLGVWWVRRLTVFRRRQVYPERKKHNWLVPPQNPFSWDAVQRNESKCIRALCLPLIKSRMTNTSNANDATNSFSLCFARWTLCLFMFVWVRLLFLHPVRAWNHE